MGYLVHDGCFEGIVDGVVDTDFFEALCFVFLVGVFQGVDLCELVFEDGVVFGGGFVDEL